MDGIDCDQPINFLVNPLDKKILEHRKGNIYDCRREKNSLSGCRYKSWKCQNLRMIILILAIFFMQKPILCMDIQNINVLPRQDEFVQTFGGNASIYPEAAAKVVDKFIKKEPNCGYSKVSEEFLDGSESLKDHVLEASGQLDDDEHGRNSTDRAQESPIDTAEGDLHEFESIIDGLNKLKGLMIKNNLDLDGYILRVKEIRNSNAHSCTNVNGSCKFCSNLESLSKEYDFLLREIDMVRRGNIYYSRESGHILNKITVMEALHGLYIVYRTPFTVLRHNFALYRHLENLTSKMAFHHVPNGTHRLCKYFRHYFNKSMDWTYNSGMRLLRFTHLSKNFFAKKTLVLDSVMSKFLNMEFHINVYEHEKVEEPTFFSIYWSKAKRLLYKHYIYTKFAVLENRSIDVLKIYSHPSLQGADVDSGYNLNYMDSEQSGDLYYLNDSKYTSRTVLLRMYSYRVLVALQSVFIQIVRHVCLLSRIFIKEPGTDVTVDTYSTSLWRVKDDSIFNIKNFYIILRNISLITLHRFDKFLDFCFNHANTLNPELTVLVPRDLSNRIFFISVIIIISLLMILFLRFTLDVLSLLVGGYVYGSGSSLNKGRMRNMYQKSLFRHLIQTLMKSFTPQNKTHQRRKHRHYRNYDDENTHDGFKTFKNNSRM